MRISFTVIPGKTITCTLRIQVTVINDNLHAERTGHRLHIEGGGKINVSGHTGFPCVCLYTVDYACSHGNSTTAAPIMDLLPGASPRKRNTQTGFMTGSMMGRRTVSRAESPVLAAA